MALAKRIIASSITVLAFVAAFAFALCACPLGAYADEDKAATSADAGSVGSGLQGSWADWRPNPGDTIDVSKAYWNTTIHIEKAGVYRLVGQSENVRVLISAPQGQTITVKLADGLNIDPSITSNIGVRTAAIEIAENKGSTVKLVSEAGSSSYFGSYLLCPAIRKDGTQTKLVFETEDPANPGSIAANASYSSGSAGIGSVFVLSYIATGTTGNIEINSGRVVAKGGNGGAGIGGGCRGNAQNITINGGIVEAEGVDGGAGIGGGYGRNGKDITINGGDVFAISTDGNGAGIGGGEAETVLTSCLSRGENIRINGGNVTAQATGDKGAGIGSGGLGLAQGIYISGGTVNAESYGDGAGIGSGGGKESGVTDIYISGGDVTAVGGRYVDANNSAGIGGHFYQKNSKTSQMNIVISGGTVNATGEVGIGAIHGHDIVYNNPKTSITISGGTITAKGLGILQDVGYYNSNRGCTTTITGGSLNADRVVNPVDKWGNSVSKTIVAIEGAADGTRITGIDLSGASHADAPYGTNDVRTIDNEVYPWICSDNSVTSAVDSNGAIYTGKANVGFNGVLHAVPNVVFNANVSGGSNGSAYVRSYTTSLSNIVTPTGPDHWTIIGYGTTADPNAAAAKLVVNADGSLIRSVEGYTDDNGRWIHQMDSSGKVILYAWWHEPAYTIAFDANVPAMASTQVSGSMDTVTAKIGQSVVLQTCGFDLPGYKFTGWNTKADGTGGAYADASTVLNLSQDDGTTATLYAQWEPLSYDIVMKAENQEETISATFDESVELRWPSSSLSKSIIGWEGYGLGSFYADGSTVTNLCGLSQDGTLVNDEVALSAVVADDGTAYLTMTNDGEGVGLSDPLNQITLTDKDGTEFHPDWVTAGAGVYAIVSNASSHSGTTILPDGIYIVSIEGWDTRQATLDIQSGAGILSLEYFTVEVMADDHANAWIDGAGTTSLEHCLEGDVLEIGASIDEGYSFESWTAGGCAPQWQNDNPETANQTITLTGPVALQAHPAANVYQVNFDPNADDATGSMSAQDMVYGEPQNLFANGFSRDGYDFAGWTTTSSWEGTPYADGENVQNLATENGAVVTLYAQWEPHAYYVHFDPNGANTVDASAVLDQKFFRDIPQELLPCMFNLESFHFLGWNTEADGGGTQFADAATVSENLSDIDGGSVTLYAQWERDYYTVLFDANGGTGAMDPQKVEIGMGEPLDTCQFVREGYEFAGWNTAPDGSGADYQSGVALEEDLAAAGGQTTLYAQWNEELESGQVNPDDDPAKNSNLGVDGDSENSDSYSQKKLAETDDGMTGVFFALAMIAVAACVVAVGTWRRARR